MISIFKDIFSPQHRKPLVGLDIGSHAIKFVELSLQEQDKPEILSFGMANLPKDSFAGSVPAKKDLIGQAILDLFAANHIETKRISFALPSSAVFIKRISLSKSAAENLKNNIEFEASNYIPHRIDAINLDYQILDDSGAMTEVLLVAVKHEIIDAYKEIFDGIGLEGVIADVESFASQNIIEVLRKDLSGKTFAILDIGQRHITVTLVKDGVFFLSGDVSSGVRQYYDALMSSLEISFEQAGILLKGGTVPGADSALVNETIDKVTESLVAELQRQMGFFWNGAGGNKSLEEIIILGGGSYVPRLKPEIQAQFEVPCTQLDVSSVFNFSGDCKSKMTEDVSSSVALACGLGLRRSGDRAQKERV